MTGPIPFSRDLILKAETGADTNHLIGFIRWRSFRQPYSSHPPGVSQVNASMTYISTTVGRWSEMGDGPDVGGIRELESYIHLCMDHKNAFNLILRERQP